MAYGDLPEGVYMEGGKLYRKVPRIAEAWTDEQGRQHLVYDDVPRPVVLPVATDDESVSEARERAARQGADFLHPVHGWLNYGRKKATEAPENLGSGSVRYDRREVVEEPETPEGRASRRKEKVTSGT